MSLLNIYKENPSLGRINNYKVYPRLIYIYENIS